MGLDLLEANQLKEQAGYPQPYSTVTLRNPLGPVAGNPYFIFGGQGGGKYVFVDTVTGKVTIWRSISPSPKRILCCKHIRENAGISAEMVVGEGFEPSKSVTADLQSAPFGRSGTPPDLMVPTTGIELVTY